MKDLEFDLTRYPIPVKPFIGGKYVDSLGGKKHTLVSAVNDQIITRELQWATAQDVGRAVEAAVEGLKAWQAFTLDQRRDAVLAYGDLISKNAQQLHWLEGILVGKEARIGLYESGAVAETFKYYARATSTFYSEIKTRTDGELKFTVHEPYGICAGICAYNSPLGIFAMKAAPALATDYVIIIKASETNPLSTLFIVSLAAEAGIPPGVLQCITGGLEPGKALASHMRIRKLSFTGGIPAGKAVSAEAAKSNLKRVTLELGGKSPVVVFPDADLEKAAQTIASQLSMLNGQVCAMGSRVYAHHSIVDDLGARMKAIVESNSDALVPSADPLSIETCWSPVYNHHQKEVVAGFMEAGRKDATVLTGGHTVGDKGCYFQPTIFKDPAHGARVEREEVFGPVLTLSSFTTEEEALEKANNTETGLTATLWTKDFARILRFTRQMEAGTIQVNRGLALGVDVPFGGWKHESNFDRICLLLLPNLLSRCHLPFRFLPDGLQNNMH